MSRTSIQSLSGRESFRSCELKVRVAGMKMGRLWVWRDSVSGAVRYWSGFCSPQLRQHHYEALKDQNCMGIVTNAKENQKGNWFTIHWLLEKSRVQFFKNNSNSQTWRVIRSIVVGLLLVSRWLNFDYSVRASNG